MSSLRKNHQSAASLSLPWGSTPGARGGYVHVLLELVDVFPLGLELLLDCQESVRPRTVPVSLAAALGLVEMGEGQGGRGGVHLAFSSSMINLSSAALSRFVNASLGRRDVSTVAHCRRAQELADESGGTHPARSPP